MKKIKIWLRRIFFLILGIAFSLAAYLFIPGSIKPAEKIQWGVSFTKSYAEYLGLNWREVYLATLDDLKVKMVRIGLNWDEIETQPGQFYFDDYDWMFQEAEKRGIEVLPVVGFKLPRWPECRAPSWTRNFSEKEFKKAQFRMIEAVVEHFKRYSNIKRWQMENEAFIEWFGDCPPMKDSLAREKVKFLRRLDSTRPILMTESGELSSWLKSALVADELGVSLYRRVWNKYYGYSNYYLPPSFYRRKANLVRLLTGKKNLPIIVSELQLEAWTPKGVLKTPLEEQLRFMNADYLKETFNYARRTGFDTFYGWGVEWWWWLKEKGHPELWEVAKKEFSS